MSPFHQHAQDALKELIDGNRRFLAGQLHKDPVASTDRLWMLSRQGQKPFAIILTCSDSRIPVELLFDQDVGDLFVVRVAGNVLAPSVLASIEFAALKFGTPLVVVMGHSDCGAVQAAVDAQVHQNEAPSPAIERLLTFLKPATEAAIHAHPYLPASELIYPTCVENISHVCQQIASQSEVLSRLIQEDRFEVIGAMFELSSGKVNFGVGRAITGKGVRS